MSETKPTFAILGTGALGGYYGSLLARAGYEVHFLARSDYQHIADQGLRVDTQGETFTIHPAHVYQHANDMPACDVTIVSLKTTANAALSAILPGPTRDGGFALVLQNGLNVEAQTAAVLGSDRVVGGLCFLCANKIAPGHVHHLDYGRIALGEYRADQKPGGISERMRLLEHCFTSAGIEILLEEDLLLTRWKKLVWNIPYNGLSALLDVTTDQIMADVDLLSQVKDLMHEVQLGAAAYGRSIGDDFVELMLDHTRKMEPYRTSMKIDYDERRPMEVEAIFGEPVRAAKAKGVALPRIESLYRALAYINRSRCGG